MARAAEPLDGMRESTKSAGGNATRSDRGGKSTEEGSLQSGLPSSLPSSRAPNVARVSTRLRQIDLAAGTWLDQAITCSFGLSVPRAAPKRESLSLTRRLGIVSTP
jgi:hypothetical protein